MTLFRELRTLGHHVHQPTRHRLAIKRRRGAFDDVDALKEGVIYLQCVETAAVAHYPHTVEESVIDIAAVEATQSNSVITGRRTAEVGEDTGAVAQRLVQGQCTLILHLLAGDHGYRLRRGNQRTIAFGCALAGGRQIALGRRGRIFLRLCSDHHIGSITQSRRSQRQGAEANITFQRQ